MKGYISKQKGFDLVLKHNKKAIDNESIMFVPKSKKAFEIKVNDIIDLIVRNFRNQVVAPALFDNKSINMVEVVRNIQVQVNRDIKSGEILNLPYAHMHPLEFAIAEESLNLCGITKEVKTVNKKQFTQASERLLQKHIDFAKLQYGPQINKRKPVGDTKTDQSTDKVESPYSSELGK